MYQTPFIIEKRPSKVKEISKFNDLPQFGKSIVFFMTRWDNACTKISNDYDKLSESDEFKELIFYEVNSNVNYELFNIFKVESIPTFILIQDRVEVDRINGGNIYQLLKQFSNNSFLYK